MRQIPKPSIMRLFLLSTAALLLASCNILGGKRVSGNGNIVTQTPAVSSFHSVEAHGSVTIRVRQEAANVVRIETDENLLNYLDVYTENGTLVVKPKKGYNLKPSKKLVVYTSAPAYKSIAVSGSGDIVGENTLTGNEPLDMDVSGSGRIDMEVALSKVSANVSGSGDVYLKGNSREFSGSISGSGSIKAINLATDISSLHLSGAADAEVTANQKLDIHVSGSGDIRYKGNAAVTQSISGSGSVKKI